MRQKAVGAGLRPYLPTHTSPVPLYRLKDWLTLLGFEIDRGRFGVYSPSCHSLRNFERWKWLDKAGDRWAPHCANLIVLCAVKRLPGMKLVGRLPMKSPLDILTAGLAAPPFPKEGQTAGGTRQLTVHCLLFSNRSATSSQWHSKTEKDTGKSGPTAPAKCNPGIGGWGAYNGLGRVYPGKCTAAAKLTTNNQMELTAVISALSALRRKCPIIIHTDSSYVKDGITKWIHGWKAQTAGETADKKARQRNAELWQQLDELTSQFDIEWRWVKGHAGDPGQRKGGRACEHGLRSRGRHAPRSELLSTRIPHLRYFVFPATLAKTRKNPYNSNSRRAVSSAVEHCLHTAGVTGSKPVSRTRIPKPLKTTFSRAFSHLVQQAQKMRTLSGRSAQGPAHQRMLRQPALFLRQSAQSP